MLLNAILGPVGAIASSWLDGRNEKIKASTKVKVAKAEEASAIAEIGSTISKPLNLYLFVEVNSKL